MAADELVERPGWAEFVRAADELHAAEVLLADPLAPAHTAVPHLRGFWSAIVAAGNSSKLGAPDTDTPQTWLAGQLPGLDAKLRAALIDHVRALESGTPSAKQLRAHARAARALLRPLEPVIGGVPLRRRSRQILLAWAGAAIVLTPVLLYALLHREVTGEGPWLATYFTDRKLEKVASYVREDDITHDWGKDGPMEAIPPDKFSIRWDTCLRQDEAGSVVFQINANDGARVFLDGVEIINGWDKDATARRGFGSAEIQVEAGVHHLRVEYFESLGAATIKFVASFAGEVPVPIPRERLLYPGDDFDEADPCAAVR
jgi:hypothetical protein